MLWRTLTMTAPAERAWEALVDLRAWPQWGPTVAGARLTGGGTSVHPDATGSVQTVVGLWLPFVIPEFEEAASADGTSRWSWRVAGVPATSHTVTALGMHRCRVAFGAPAWAVAYVPVLDLGLRRVRRLAESGWDAERD